MPWPASQKLVVALLVASASNARAFRCLPERSNVTVSPTDANMPKPAEPASS